MRVGIVAEGRGDYGVLARVLKGALGVESDELTFICPEFNADATDTHAMDAAQHSNWALVLDACRSGESIREFLQAPTAEAKFVVVQIDTAECELSGFGVARPTPPDAMALCVRVATFVGLLMDGDLSSQTCFAVSMEETEAWLLPLYSNIDDSCNVHNAKERLQRVIARTNALTDTDRTRLASMSEYDRMLFLAKPYARRKNLNVGAKCNVSLKRFVDDLTTLAAAK